MSFYHFERVTVIREGKHILGDVSFTLERGLFHTLFGPSGSGKTTLLRLFNLMTVPTAGTIAFNEKSIEEYDVTWLRRNVAIVFQEPVVFPGTGRDNLNVSLRFAGSRKKSSDDGEFERILEICQLPGEYLDRDVSSLSGGEKQRLAIARVLLMEPQVLLLDEPTSALDVIIARNLIQSLRDHYRDMTLIVVSHSLELIAQSDRSLHLVDGQIRHIYDKLDAESIERLLEEHPQDSASSGGTVS